MAVVLESWSQVWDDRRFRLWSALTVPALFLVLSAMGAFVGWVEGRPGAVLPDPVLALLPARDVSWLAASAVYAALALSLPALARRPRDLLLAVHAYAVMVAFRMLVMWATPLDPPAGMVALRDPLVEALGTGQVLTRDLFFSGHVSTVVLLALAARGRAAKPLLAGLAALVAACVLLQHVHYAVDALAAPAFAYAAFRAAKWIHRLGGLDGPGWRRCVLPSSSEVECPHMVRRDGPSGPEQETEAEEESTCP